MCYVISKVPTILLYMLWHKYKPDEPFPVSTCYLSKIFEMLGDMYDVDIRHELGTTFSIILKEHAVVSIQAMTNVLSDSQFTCAGTSRENIEQLYKQLSTIYAFLFPDSLCEFAQRVQVTSTLGQITHLSDQLLAQLLPKWDLCGSYLNKLECLLNRIRVKTVQNIWGVTLQLYKKIFEFRCSTHQEDYPIFISEIHFTKDSQ